MTDHPVDTILVEPRMWACATCGHVRAESRTWKPEDGCTECGTAWDDGLHLVGGIPEEIYDDEDP